MQPEPYVDCGHDLDAYARQADELAQARAENAAAREGLRDLRDELGGYREALTLAEQANERLAADVDELRMARDSALRWLREKTEAYDTLGTQANDHMLRAVAAEADRDRLADTVRRYQPVIDAAKAWYAACDPHTIAALDVRRPAVALGAALDALGDAGQDDDFTPMVGTVDPDTAAIVARATGGGIRSTEMAVEFDDEGDGNG